jgi:hypothetical protein
MVKLLHCYFGDTAGMLTMKQFDNAALKQFSNFPITKFQNPR